jgi:hypothetical protein
MKVLVAAFFVAWSVTLKLVESLFCLYILDVMNIINVF